MAQERRGQPGPNAQDRARSDRSTSRGPSGRRLWLADVQSQRSESISHSPTSDAPFEPTSPGPQDRVFPIRSVISVDPNPTPAIRSETGETFPGMSGTIQSASTGRKTSDSRRYSFGSAQSNEAPRSEWSETASRGGRPRAEPSGGSAQTIVNPRRARRPTVDDGEEIERLGGQRQMQILTDEGSVKSESTHSQSAKSAAPSFKSIPEATGGIYTARFQHVAHEGGHFVVTGRDGEVLQRCEDEPIHIPGAVQGFGLMIVFREDSEGRLHVRVASENSKRIIGYTPGQLFSLGSFCDILSEEQTDNLLDHLEFIKDADTDPAANGPEVFTMSIRSPSTKKSQKLWCAMHINEKHPDLIIAEFELEDDPDCPLVPRGETPDIPEDTLSSNPTAEELADSTINMSKPLRVLRSARRKKGDAAAMEVFNIMSQVQEQLAGARTLELFLKVLVGTVKELTGFHRVMLYQFDNEFNGKVVSELVDVNTTKDLYKGLNFPASDIPKQARDLYKINKVRLLYDRDQATARLVCRSADDLEMPVDMTYAYLRAMSPIHIKYLTNMAVRSSMSISINAFDELWGLISCHSYGQQGMRVSFPIRKMCRLVGDTASRNIERLSYASRLQARKLINTIPTEKNPSGYIIASSDDLLNLFDADYGLLSIRDETKLLGGIGPMQEALAMLEYLRVRKFTTVLTSHDIRIDFPDLIYPPGFSIIAGLLLVPLTAAGDDFIVFFRKGQLREVKWAGNPYEKFVRQGTEGYLEPRKSFKLWSETVVGKCRSWTEEQVETASVLCLVYGKFIEVWRQKEAALQNSQLTRLLLANSAHEVRTPLNAIINYLEIAMEGPLDQETRENLLRSHSASKSLIYVINDLLDLTKTEEGKNLIKYDIFDLPATVKEATTVFMNDAKRKKLNYGFSQNPGVPQFVVGDQRRVRQAISNVIANAIKHTSSGTVSVELWLARADDQRVDVDIVVQDSGTGMSAKKLDDLFRELEQVQSEDDQVLQELAPETFNNSIVKDSSEKRTLGLGLAIVSRIVRNMNGQLRLKSEEGKGSRFVIQLGFELPENETETLTPTPQLSRSDTGTEQPVTPLVTEGEVMLVFKGEPKTPDKGLRQPAVRQNSQTSLQSFRSNQSGKSDVDRLVDAIQGPLMPSQSKRSSLKGSRPSIARSQSGDPTTTQETVYSPGSAIGPVNRDIPVPGQEYVVDQKTPIKPVRVLDDEDTEATNPQPSSSIRSNFKVSFEASTKDPASSAAGHSANELRVLVAEDDPINSRIITKRIEKLGHSVHLTVNGEECAAAFGDKPADFDLVLMDMQVCFHRKLMNHPH